MFKLNCDAIVDPASRAGCGGILHNHHGVMISAFSQNIGRCLILKAELWAIFISVHMSRGRDFKILFIELDSQIVVSLLINDYNNQHDCFSLVNRIKAFEANGDRFSWKYIFRGANQVVGCLV